MNALICSLNSSSAEECIKKLKDLSQDTLDALKKERKDDRFGDNLLIALSII